MKKFNEFLAERAGKGLTIFDIDDTLFVSKARVIVRNTNTGKTKALTPMSLIHINLEIMKYMIMESLNQLEFFIKQLHQLVEWLIRQELL